MTFQREGSLAQAMSALLAGEIPQGFDWPDEKEAYAWRVIRWESDMPLDEAQLAALREALEQAMKPIGICASRPDPEGDGVTAMLCLTRFPAHLPRKMALWLCAHALMEEAGISLEQEGLFMVGEEFASPLDFAAHSQDLMEVSDWWAQASPIPGQEARLHRTHLQTIIKRRQYTSLGGYVTRALRGAQEPGRMCFAFVPLVLEAVWSQHAELSLRSLTEGLNLHDMARRPRDTLMAWLASLPPILRQSPAAGLSAPIDRVIASIQTDCSLPYSQQNLSRSLGLTPAYFCRLFHEKTGQHFSAFLTRTRMEKAQSLLGDGSGRTLSEISAACGYPNKSYFCQVFKKYTGMTPGEYEQRRLDGNA